MKQNKTLPRVTLVGAGPGDPELISVKGLKAITQADVILYDALISKELLKYAKKGTKLVFVGKRASKHTFDQDKINRLIVENAINHGHVVRLKGGDSFVFGRGHEELSFVRALNIEVTVIPGITSAISVPELQNIPLTKRGISEGFWVITGTVKSHQLSADINLAAQSSSTVVILMGMNKLEEIVKIFEFHGRSKTPIAIIQNGSLPNEKIGIGEISNILKVVKDKNLESPAVIVIGDVVKEHKSIPLNVFDKHFLQSCAAKN